MALLLTFRKYQSMIKIMEILTSDTPNVSQTPVVYIGLSSDLKATLAKMPPSPPPIMQVADASARLECEVMLFA